MQDPGISVLFKGSNFIRLLEGLFIALRISFLSVVISLLLGFFIGVLISGKNRFLKFVYGIYLNTVRIMPQMVLLFIVFFGSTRVLGINIDAEVSSIIVFAFWGSAEMADLVRGAIKSIPLHQFESAASLGMRKRTIYLKIICLQTLRRLVPSSINLVTRMIKTTSLVMMIGVVEVLKVGQQIIEANRTTSPNIAFWMYGTVFLLYFIACFPISRLSKRLEEKWKLA